MRARSNWVWLAALALGSAGWAESVQARDVYWSLGVAAPGVAAGFGNAPPVVYAPPPVVVQPPPVYVRPRPVYVAPTGYYAPPPVVYGGGPVYYGPPGHWKHRKRHDRHHHHHHHGH